ncbi:unnamed protein product [Lepidochelys olivacea]
MLKTFHRRKNKKVTHKFYGFLPASWHRQKLVKINVMHPVLPLGEQCCHLSFQAVRSSPSRLLLIGWPQSETQQSHHGDTDKAYGDEVVGAEVLVDTCMSPSHQGDWLWLVGFSRVSFFIDWMSDLLGVMNPSVNYLDSLFPFNP